ncbi:ABC transporter ATP-binding protein [Pseudonocardia hydrocarbonoxydans]|uniref:Transporter n=1 Tax=Pseudonocardia hydrocarbonoxydans TaxID=76726 RepID=A0A4Y3WWA9_9PSEU|nr:ATP-binding cassette domain-containing protein [Pseudonocardia hydrocarbonoxydans]GEC22019.1 transporter [Pseudonocardia hydrocarbonoxydans]
MNADPGPGRLVCELSGVSAGYRRDVDVLTGVDLRVPHGCTLLTGPNGSGKSTVVELVAGTLRPSRGSVTVLGLPASTPELRSRRTVCRATPALYPALTVSEHVSLLEIDPGSFAERAGRYGLARWLDTPVHGLSTGNVRKAWLLLTTGAPGELLVLDEPFNGLDPQGVGALAGDIDTWMATGCSVTVVAHEPPEVFRDLVEVTIRIAGPGLPEPAGTGPR